MLSSSSCRSFCVPAGWLAFAEGVVYEAYETDDALWGISPVEDQQAAGAVMKVIGGFYLWTIIAVRFFRLAANNARAEEQARRDHTTGGSRLTTSSSGSPTQVSRPSTSLDKPAAQMALYVGASQRCGDRGRRLRRPASCLSTTHHRRWRRRTCPGLRTVEVDHVLDLVDVAARDRAHEARVFRSKSLMDRSRLPRSGHDSLDGGRVPPTW